MFNAEQLQEKWAPVLNHDGLPEIKDNYRKSVTAILLENQEKALNEERAVLTEAPTNVGPINTQTTGAGAVYGFDPILISLIRRAMPKLIAYDIAGVQPMSGPTGLIFAMRSRYTNQTGGEAFFDEPDAQFSGTKGGTPPTATTEKNPGLINDATGGGTTSTNYALASSKFSTTDLEGLGDSANNAFMEMAFSIDRIAVEAKGRALRADYSVELAQDLKAIHGLDAESELANILSTEILAEINREVVRTVYRGAKPGAQANVANQGVFDLDVDSNGRWSVEKFKGLMFQVERDANAIAQQTRRGKGNFILTSADVASALAMSGTLDYSSGLTGPGGPSVGDVDDTGNLLVGTMNGRIKVYVDPYSANVSTTHYYVAGYKGSSPYDAGLFYCPYVPLQMLRSVDPSTFQPKIGFKTRYGMVANPFVTQDGTGTGTPDAEALTHNKNQYYRRVRVANLM